MKFVCSGLDLLDALGKVSKAVSTKANNIILEGIKISAAGKTLVLNATDLELSIQKKIKAEVITEGQIVVPSKLFCELIRKLSHEQIEFSLQDKSQLKIKYSDNVVFLQCYDATDFPEFKTIVDSDYFEISQKALKILINKSVINTASDDIRPILKGCLLETEGDKITAVALDGFRLAVIEQKLAKATAQFSAVTPARSLIEISKLLGDTDGTVKIYLQKNVFMCDLKETIILTRQLDGDFINYKKIIPQANTSMKLTINRQDLINALERASLMSRIDKNNIVKFDITTNMLTITSNSEAGEIVEKIATKTKIEKLKIAFNAKYMLDILAAQEDEFLDMFFDGSLDPCIIKPLGGVGYLYLVLPVRAE